MSGLGQLNLSGSRFIGICLEGFLYGRYSGIFAMYIQYRCSKQSAILFYSVCTLYVLSTLQYALDFTVDLLPAQAATWFYNLSVNQTVIQVVSGCCDFMAQSILIYRCWIVWNRDIRAVIIPLILALIFLGLWVVTSGALVYDASVGEILCANWGNTSFKTSFPMSLTVNALVTSLIVLKILKVSEVKPFCGQTYGPSGGSKLQPKIFVIIESGMVSFALQLTRVVLSIVWTNAAVHDQPSLEEIASSLHFGSDQGRRNSIPGTGSHVIVHEENRDDGIGVQVMILSTRRVETRILLLFNQVLMILSKFKGDEYLY